MPSLDVFFDPLCPWTWVTSRWVVEVAPRRNVAVRWRAFSLTVKNEGAERPVVDHTAADHTRDELSLGALRVVEAVWADEGDAPIGRLYTEMGQRFHLHHDQTMDALRAALTACGLDPAVVSAAGDERWDAEIEGSMADAAAVVGDDVGVPVLVLHDAGQVHGICGPVMSSAPTGDEALELWDHVMALSARGNFFELKRSRTTAPEFAGEAAGPGSPSSTPG